MAKCKRCSKFSLFGFPDGLCPVCTISVQIEEEAKRKHQLQVEAEKKRAEAEEARKRAEEEARRASDPLIPFCNAHNVGDVAEYLIGIRVSGVTFKNSRRSRQTILRQIYWHDAPYKKRKITVSLILTEHDGEPAIRVYVGGDDDAEHIGFIPKGLVPYLVKNWDRIRQIYDFVVYGGGDVNFGARLSLQILLPNTDAAPHNLTKKEGDVIISLIELPRKWDE